MPIAVTCSCGKQFSVPDHFAGKSGRCTGCGAPLDVPGTPTGTAAADPFAASGEQLASFATSAGERVLGGYKLKKKLGDKKSDVYLAMAPDGRQVALKILLERQGAQASDAKRFLREARSLSGLEHENLVKSLDAGEELGALYLAMELFEARNVRELMTQAGGRLPENRAIQIARGVAQALGYLSSRGLIHRNVMPEHILVNQALQVKLVGLGLVKEVAGGDAGAPLTVRGETLGTPQYMSPEQAESMKDLDIRSDLFSLGSTLFEVLAGKPPWSHASAIRVLQGVAKEPPPSLKELAPHVSPATVRVVEKLLEKKREARYQTADALAQDLAAIERGALVNGLPPSFAGGAQGSSATGAPATGAASEALVKKLLIAVGLLAACVVLLVIALVVILLSR